MDEQLARLGRDGSGRAELMAEYFEPISVRSLAALLGLGELDADTLRRWFARLAQGATNFEDDPGKQADADAERHPARRHAGARSRRRLHARGPAEPSGQWDAFVADPSGRVRAAVDEGLRWMSPIVASANRDPAVWGETADAFDLFRPQRRSAAFGFGKHFCVGITLQGAALGRTPAPRGALPAAPARS